MRFIKALYIAKSLYVVNATLAGAFWLFWMVIVLISDQPFRWSEVMEQEENYHILAWLFSPVWLFPPFIWMQMYLEKLDNAPDE